MAKQPTLVRTPFGSYVLKKDKMPSACKACKSNELRDLVYALLYTLPSDLVSEFAQEHLALTAVTNSPDKED